MSIIQIFTSHFHFIKLPFPLKHYVKNGILLDEHAYLSPTNLNIAYKVQSPFYKRNLFQKWDFCFLLRDGRNDLVTSRTSAHTLH